MADHSKIEWTDATWNVVIGCDKVSPGCDNCYAIRVAHRMRANPNKKVSAPYSGTESGMEWTGQVNLVPHRLDLPLRWKRPRRIFVNAQSDLFHDAVPTDYIIDVFAIMAKAKHHTFQVLSKRHGRMRSLLSDPGFAREMWDRLGIVEYPEVPMEVWPLPNVWLGVSAENQQWFNTRWRALRETPAAVRWISAEPLLDSITLCCCDGGSFEVRQHPFLVHPDCPLHGDRRLDWVVVGGESGPKARPMHPHWARSLRDQCSTAGVPFLFKQWGEWGLFGDTAHYLAKDGTLYAPDDLIYPDGPRYDEALRAGHNRGLHTVYRVGKKRAGRVLDGRTWDEYPIVESLTPVLGGRPKIGEQ